MLVKDILKEVKKNYPSADTEKIKTALEFAKKAHSGQNRLSGEPYFSHPYEVAIILAELGMDETTIIASLLHDVVEDTDVTTDMIRARFGSEVAVLVDSVTKMNVLDYRSREEREAESIRKMVLAMANDIRVILIKLADRLHNMRTLQFQPEEKQHEKAKETLEIYAPIANRLGISSIQWELEDLSFKYIEPEIYADLKQRLARTRAEREDEIKQVIEQVQKGLVPVNIKAEIAGRPKHIYSIYSKMQEKNKTFDEIYDITAIRIIVNSVKDCYGVLGIVHTLWKPIPGRFKDYIAVPKQNMYQSLHTTLLGANGQPFEVQIRTYEMHKIAEYGIAAHWQYKEKEKKTKTDDKLVWIREILEWQKDLKDSKEFVEYLKLDIFQEDVFVFTPKGKVKDFPKGSTPIDFAYAIHSEIGDKCVGAKVNGKIVTLDYKLKTGDIVEIITSQTSKGPSRDWLKFIKTNSARSKIRNYFKRESKDENIAKGREMLEKEAKRYGFDLQKLLQPDFISNIFKKFTLKSIDDMYAAVGFGGISTGQIINRFIEEIKKTNKEEIPLEEIQLKKDTQNRRKSGVTVKGYGQMVIRFAKCCNPVPGDDIIGYITRGRGVSVHRKDCTNINDIDFEKGRLIEVSWLEDENYSYEVEIEVVAADRKGLIADITSKINDLNLSLSGINARSMKNHMASIKLTVEIKSKEHLDGLINKLKNIESVKEVFRIGSH
ncbi:MAG: bifunctional (p)ppGpp synthetase/guanosine-3',5'-bis(diphosphate) 3'-pyrophosphohydrolase [Eubacteriales bacterium]